MSIKIIEDLEPWEVMRRACEGKPVVYRAVHNGTWREDKHPAWNWYQFNYAIIDTTEPVIDWSKFNYKFFNEYGCLPVAYKGRSRFVTNSVIQRDTSFCLRESPFYYWPGGKCPVPSNVEVEVILRNAYKTVISAGNYRWTHTGKQADIIAFRLTGNFL